MNNVISRESTLSRVMPATWVSTSLLVVTGSLLVALCARISVPLPFTPVPVSLSNFGVLLVGLLLGGRLGCAALLLYLVEGSAGLPVFSNGSLGIFGPTGGYLMAYPLVAFLAGALRGKGGFARALSASIIAEIVLFAAGISWLMLAFHTPLRLAAHWGLYPFLVAEAAKVIAAAGIASRSSSPASRPISTRSRPRNNADRPWRSNDGATKTSTVCRSRQI